MNWHAVGLWAFSHLRMFFAGIGLTEAGGKTASAQTVTEPKEAPAAAAAQGAV